MPAISKKNFVTAALILILSVFAVNIVSKSFSSEDNEYISGSSSELSYSDVRNYLTKADFSGDNSREYFKNELVNKYTLKFFKYLQETFKDMTYEQHIEAVRKYLNDSMDSESAEKFLDIYKKFLIYEKRLASDLNSNSDLSTTEDYLGVLRNMKKLQIEIFGEKNADIIFGASMKAQEYPIRKSGIVNDSSLYGKEKEERIKKLNQEMWGESGDGQDADRKPYDRYTEKVEIYSKDLNEMTESEKQKTIREFRKNVFSPEVVKKLEEVDAIIDADKLKETLYLSACSEIRNNSDLSEQEKRDRIYNLQNETFGDEADSVRRMEEIESGKNVLLNKYNKN
jgi:lipase chaperone LimK